jgi:hypothetical protein
MALQADGSAWEEECARPFAAEAQSRQPFLPDGLRSFEEIDRLGIGSHGLGNLIGARADVDFYRIEPPSGFTKGLPGAKRTDMGEGDILPEVHGRDFFPYRPIHIDASPPRANLARIVNAVQRVLSSGEYQGCDLDPGQPAHRGGALLVQPPARHDRAAVRQFGAAPAWLDQQRWAAQHRRCRRLD